MEDLYGRFGGQFQNVTIVFPNKRAGLFANQYLSEIAGQPVWAPRYTTISELFSSLTDKEVPEKIELLIYLYNAYQKSRKEEKVEFDAFYGWGEVLLSDFQDIDNNMVDAAELFSNISALEAINRLDYLEPGQVEAIKSFFTDFDPDDTNRLHRRFVDMWNSMTEIYTQFRCDLAADGLAYEAMLKREVVEMLGETNMRTHYAFVGFNVLNETERRLFKYLQTNAQALFYWDYDPTFIRHEAARFIEDNLRQFPNALTTSAQPSATNGQLNIVSASTDEAQVSYMNHWLKAHLPSDRPLNQTAVVLADENLLQGVLHALPDTEVNITMGYPLRQTAIASLISALLDMQTRGKARGDSWYHTYVTAILRHPYILQVFPNQAKTLYGEMHRHNEMYPSIEYIKTYEPPFSDLFIPMTTETLLPYLADIVKRIGIANKYTDPLTVESIFTAYTIITSLHSSLFDSALHRVGVPVESITLHFISNILNQQMASQSIAFHGEPATGLQVMGMLETRNIDFKDIVILSANEGTLPKVSQSASFIPYFLREANNMTTIEKQTSLYAYYFYRLLQRAGHVSLVYNSSTEGLKRGEMSRFLMQLKLEKELPMTVTEQTVTSPIEPQILTPHASLLTLHSALNSRLSPSAINTYLSCKMQFFLKYVAKLHAQDEISEEIEADMFGSITHEVLEKIYSPYIGKMLTGSFINGLAADKKRIEDLVDHAFSHLVFNQPSYIPPKYNGEQMLNRHVIIQYITRQLHYDATLAPLTILALEKEVESQQLITHSSSLITLTGRIDRMDEVTIEGKRVTRIVDYKTSSRIQSVKTVDDLFDPEKTSPHIFQTLCYADMMDNGLAPALNYIKKLSDKEHTQVVCIGKDPVYDYADQLRSDFHPRLVALVQEIFDPDIPFAMAETEKPCTFCDFKQICNRQGVRY